MKRIICILTIAMCSLMAYAQHHEGRPGHFNPGDFKEKLERVIKEKAGFNDDEAAKFFPIFHELHEKQRALNHEAVKLKRETKGEQGDEAVAKAIKRINAIKVEVAKLDEAYYERMCKAVPAVKVLKAMKAEDKFHRDMLKRMSENAGPKAPKGKQKK